MIVNNANCWTGVVKEEDFDEVVQQLLVMACKRIGIVGFGNLGRYLYDELRLLPEYEVVFVWNRTTDKMKGIVEDEMILNDLAQFSSRCPDIVVEVAHPDILREYGVQFIQSADLMIGSPTALADESLLRALLESSDKSKHGLHVATGALWGASDIQKMADQGTLKGLKVTMKKHPSHLKVCGRLVEAVAAVRDVPVTLYEGPVKDLCPLAPNNVNTMACAALAAHNLGFGEVQGCLVADPSLACHVVQIEVKGPGSEDNYFSVNVTRINPARSGNVTGKQTFVSFLNSIKGVTKGVGGGVHIC